jgi:tRNA (cytidine/uridine-2'-O-)-methyltransferase
VLELLGAVRVIHVALYRPQIPPNTGAIIRLCANAGAQLHLVGPLGFHMDDRALKRAGLDYHELATVRQHASLAELFAALPGSRVLAFSTRGAQRYDRAAFRDGDLLLFGAEDRGLPDAVLAALPPEQRLKLPMRAGNRSLNLANAAAIALYEAWRQLEFMGAD